MVLPLIGAGIAAAGNVLGGYLSSEASKKNALLNIKYQKEFAQSGIQWRAADAQKAGIHPLAALGAQLHSFSPVSISDGLGEGISKAGQNIGRAVEASATPEEKASNESKAVALLNLERLKLGNDLLRSQVAASNIAVTRQAGTSPGIPTSGTDYLVPGQRQSGIVGNNLVKREPVEVAAVDPNKTSSEPAAVASHGFLRTPTGWAPVMSKDAKDRLEEDTGGMIGWNIGNRVAPSLGFARSPPNVPIPPGHKWYFNPVKQEYYHSSKPRYQHIYESLQRIYGGK